MTEPLSEETWALQNKLNPFPVAGTLAWDGDTISFTLGAMAGEASLGWVEKRLGSHGLADRLKGGEKVQAFSWPKGSFEASWPKLYGGSVVEVNGSDGTSWLISLDYPSGGSISQTISLFTGRKKGKAWKAALA
ncbi:MAG: hypothetical protein JWN99_2807 [Ilumatobacteraceae bacterium]|nr:hypothetical protein [Ilumatobacteraceae bacterium]